MTTFAQAIETISRGKSADAFDLAEKHAIAKDQNWNDETTEYVFDDNSVLVLSSNNAYAKTEQAA